MAKLPAYGRELLSLRLDGRRPLSHPYAGAGAHGLVVVTDLWVIARCMRELGRHALVAEQGVVYNWRLVKGLIVYLMLRAPADEMCAAIESERPADIVRFPSEFVSAYEEKCELRLASLGVAA